MFPVIEGIEAREYFIYTIYLYLLRRIYSGKIAVTDKKDGNTEKQVSRIIYSFLTIGKGRVASDQS